MANPITRFEVTVLRPAQILIAIAAIALAARFSWWWIAGGIVALLYLGAIGSRLHTLQTAAELAEGPANGPAARVEANQLPPAVQTVLVGAASTRLGILAGCATFSVAWLALGTPWYLALGGAWIASLLLGVILKLTFGAV